MAITVDKIAEYLDSRSCKYKLDAVNSRITIKVQADNLENLTIVAQLDDDGQFFKLFAPEVISGVKDHPYKDVILQTMLCISWETKMLQWEYDPSDGEIRAIIEFPLEDGTLTQRQFYRCLNGLVEMVDDFAMPRLQAVMETGKDPGDPEAGERLLLMLQEESPRLLDLLEQAMEVRKKRGTSPFED
ncbi:MAG TPA: hypothetical protein V6D03_14545 [Candidatus Caenarcaniphilales bacterium]